MIQLAKKPLKMFDFNSMFDFGIGDFRRAPPHGYVNQGSDFVRPYESIAHI